MITSTSTLTDVAFAVCTALDAAGFVAVLTGGSAATYYAPEAYISRDLDFVITLTGKHGEDVLKTIGYHRAGQFYRHDKTAFTLDFPLGPLAIGDDRVTSWATIRRETEMLHVLTATDSCRDRLASYLFWDDFQGLEQSLYVFRTQRQQLDLPAIKEWCGRERQLAKYVLFEQRALGGE